MPERGARAAAERRSNSIGRALRVLGDRWTLLVLRDAFFLGTRRFQDWRDGLGVSDPVLAQRLRDLVAEGVLERRRYIDNPPRDEYWLTPAGLDLWSTLVAIWAWEKSWAPGKAGVLPELLHDGCGHTTDPLLACGNCLVPVTGRDTSATVAAGAGWDRSVPPRHRRRSSRVDERVDPELMFPQTMTLLGDRWSTMILGAAFLGTRRFTDFERELRASPSLLSGRLAGFLEMGVLEKVAEGGRDHYRLTAKGLAFFPVIALLMHWGDTWDDSAEGPPLAVTHRACGARFEPVLLCAGCGGGLKRDEVRWQRGTRQLRAVAQRTGRG